MKWLDEIREKEADDFAFKAMTSLNGASPVTRRDFKEGFDAATKAISEKLQEIYKLEKCSSFCSHNLLDKKCDCWKAKLKELGLVK